MYNIILCGGSGTRLWPISRHSMPKQFTKIFDNKSLFEMTLERNSSYCDSIMIVSNENQYFLALDQSKENSKLPNKYLLEPIGRNTAPAIALSCFDYDYDDIVLITPSDHLIKNKKKYYKMLDRASELARLGNIVIFGIEPDFAETGFGYIEANGEDVLGFKEKPNFETATSYIESGGYYWNSGMFCFKAGVFLDELKKYSPKIYDMSKKAFQNTKYSDNLMKIAKEDMLNIPEDSIDYAVIEKSKLVKMVKADIEWSDVGSFEALDKEIAKDNNGNSLNESLFSIDSYNNFIYSSNKKIVTIGIKDCIIVDTNDALLISSKGNSQQVKQVVEKLKKENSKLHDTHLKVFKPWGNYTILEESIGYKIKKIEVSPNKRLSLQKHMHRNEHWIVLSGTATVQVGNEIKIIRPNESTYIKMGEIHRLSNEGKIPVIIIETQVGEYTEEDDIIRIEDDFKRG